MVEINYDDVFKNLPQILEYITPKSYLDIGASKGQNIEFICKQLPSLEYVEMIEANYEHESDLKQITNQTGFPYHIEVLSDSIKEVKFYIDKNPNRPMAPGNSYYQDKTSAFLDFSYELRTTNTLDIMYPTETFDLIKLDTQGSELDIIKGGLNLISRAKALILEESVTQNYHDIPLAKDNKDFLEKNNFIFVKHLKWYGHWVKDTNGQNMWREEVDSLYIRKDCINKLPISIGILSWNSDKTLKNTLKSYQKNKLFDIVNDITIFFQETSENDIKIAKEYNINYITSNNNIGISKAFLKLAKNAKTENILLLEHDWELIEDFHTTYSRLQSGLKMLNSGYQSIKYRHRNKPGHPLYTELAYRGRELKHYDEWHDCISPHLLDSIHWLDPSINFSDKIQKQEDYFITNSRWGSFTNNPCLYKKDFYINLIKPFLGDDISLEKNIVYWWCRQNFKVAHGEGLFTHNDIQKYGT